LTYVITQACIDVNDRSCIEVCPVDCIHDAGRMLVIDPEECIDCGACESACPVEAIYVEGAMPEHLAVFEKVNAAILESPAAAAAAVDTYAADHGLPAIEGYRP
jgi:NAD-dependent dihydropyrimidine dehydrogenase PreA subunit